MSAADIVDGGPPEIVARTADEVGESPLWDDRDGTLLWVDMPRGVVRRWQPATGQLEEATVGDDVSVLALRSAGGYVVGVGRTLRALSTDLRPGEVLSEVPLDADCFLNDGVADRHGRLWVGSGTEGRDGRGVLWLIGPDGVPAARLRGLHLPNGLDFSGDGSILYLADSYDGRVFAIDVEPSSGRLGERRVVHVAGPNEGLPDGLAVDAVGRIWVAHWGGARLTCRHPDGRLAGTLRLPVDQTASCAFGGPQFTDLYITTAAIDLTADARHTDPAPGTTFRFRGLGPGRPAARFAG